MSKLGKKLFFIFLSLTVLSLSLVGIFINFSVGERFNNFINMQREENIKELASIINENLAENNNFEETASLVRNFSRSNRIPVWLADSSGEMMFFPGQNMQRSSMMRRMEEMGHMNMGARHQNNMTPREMPADLPGKTRTESIYLNGEKRLTLYWKEINKGSQLNTNLYNYFENSVYKAIIFSALIVIIIIVILSFVLSKKITEPLLNLKNAALEVARGNYKQNIEARGNDELTELINSFNQMSRKLLKLEKIRRESASDLAHELRTPLTTIKGYLEAIEDDKLKVNEENIKEMQEEAARMTNLIEKLNEFASAQNKVLNLEKENLNLKQIIKKVIKQQREFINKKNINLEFKIEEKINIRGDKDSLIQIFNNIIENAVKYNYQNGDIKIKAFKENNKIIVKIKDSGMGISDRDLPYIFERFYRADKSRNSNNQGSGIGLAVVKELIEAHQGKIEVKSSDNGSEFKVVFPG